MLCRSRFIPFLFILFLIAGAPTSAQQLPTLHIGGPGIQSIELSAKDLAKMPRLAVDVQNPHNGKVEHYDGVRVSDLLAKAGAPLGEKLLGPAMATFVAARASDGYTVVYSLAEIDPALRDNQIIVADQLNGKPLGPKEGPFKVVVPGDKRPARWIRMLTSLRVGSAINPSESSLR
jgi:hypothetical protein